MLPPPRAPHGAAALWLYIKNSKLRFGGQGQALLLSQEGPEQPLGSSHSHMRGAAQAPWNSPAPGAVYCCSSKVLPLSAWSWSPGAGCSGAAGAPHPPQGLQQWCSVAVPAQAAGERGGELSCPPAPPRQGKLFPAACMDLSVTRLHGVLLAVPCKGTLASLLPFPWSLRCAENCLSCEEGASCCWMGLRYLWLAGGPLPPLQHGLSPSFLALTPNGHEPGSS